MSRGSPAHERGMPALAMIPMRDGVRLAADLYVPDGMQPPWPVVLIRTPYDRTRPRQVADATHLAGHGYAVVVQDLRGCFLSEGTYRLAANERADGYDTLTWLAAQPWCSGRIGTYGCSHLGEVQYQLAAERHPNHTCMIPQAGGSVHTCDGPAADYLRGGVFDLLVAGWFWETQATVRPQFPAGLDERLLARAARSFNMKPQLGAVDQAALWNTLPLADMLARHGGPPSDFEDIVSHALDDPWWAGRYGFTTDDDAFDVPALHVNSWFDFAPAATLHLFNLLHSNSIGGRARGSQYVIISPTLHCQAEQATEHTLVGDLDLGDARLDYWDIYLGWFDYWLKGIDNGILEIPRVRYYLPGRNVWQASASWPPPGMEPTPFYFHSHGKANSRWGDGELALAPPEDGPPDRFTADPATPVPTLGGAIWSPGDPPAFPPGPREQGAVEARHDVLVYTTAALDEPVTIAGPVAAVVYVSSSAPDIDIAVKLVDVHPDGRAYNLQDGILRLRYREGYNRQVFMRPAEVYEATISMQALAHEFKRGHRIRVQVAGSSFPRFERNLHTGGHNFDECIGVVAHNAVYHTREFPSRLMLPILKQREEHR